MNKDDFFNYIKSYKFLANKSLGQNFLINAEQAESIVSLLNIENEDLVLEIGAGLGSLSYFLAKSNAQITLIDIDERMLSSLNENFCKYDNIVVKRQNILKENVNNYSKIVGNLPYYITSGIIEYLLLNAVNSKRIVLMVQKEVYNKLTDRKKISPLTLLLNYVAKISSSKIVGRNNFSPAPHVDSAVFVLEPNQNIKNADNKLLYRLMSKLFLHRRKTISNCLQTILPDKESVVQILDELGLSPLLRPEQIDIVIYIKLLNLLKSKDFITKI